MKIRIRHGSTTHRLVVAENATYAEIKAILSTNLKLRPGSAKLSLNKQAELGGDQEELRALGVKGGDLLWLVESLPDTSVPRQNACARQTTTARPEKQGVLLPTAGQSNKTSSSSAYPAHQQAEDPMDEAEEVGHRTSESARSPKEILARVQETASGSDELLLCTVHACFLEAGLQPSWASENEEARFRLRPALSSTHRLSYSLSTASESSSCQVTAMKMGHFLALSGSVEGHSVHTLSLDAKKHEGSLQPSSGGGHAWLLSNAAELWIVVKDKLVRPLVAEMRVALGLTAPISLASLPAELADKVFNCLEVPDLALLMRVSKELRFQACSTTRWEALTLREFGWQLADKEDAKRLGWLCIYRIKHQERETLRRRTARVRRLERRRAYPFAPPPHGGLFAGRLNSYGHAGGDYDRNPLVNQGSNPVAGRLFVGGHSGWGLRFV